MGLTNTRRKETMVDAATLDRYVDERMAWVEAEIETVLASRTAELDLYGMLRYHLGWCDRQFAPIPREERRRYGGKKLRGVLAVLACEAVGGDGRRAAPGAAAIEFIHNFSLIHDDIEDGDRERRHRPTVWAIWGVPQGVNAGSNMQALVTLAGLQLAERGVPAATVVAAIRTLTEAMLAMTEGQFLDIGFQDRWEITVDDYLEMASGKTAALAGAMMRLGGLLGTDDPARIEALARFGQAFGLAFQARDDFLGIWGDSALTGKPVGADILRGKRSLPIAFGLSHPEGGARVRALLEARDVPGVTTLLERIGARAFAEETVRTQTAEALAALDRARAVDPAGAALRAIADQALGREH
jgi:geranylgeranyl diphosphate synthase type I